MGYMKNYQQHRSAKTQTELKVLQDFYNTIQSISNIDEFKKRLNTKIIIRQLGFDDKLESQHAEAIAAWTRDDYVDCNRIKAYLEAPDKSNIIKLYDIESIDPKFNQILTQTEKNVKALQECFQPINDVTLYRSITDLEVLYNIICNGKHKYQHFYSTSTSRIVADGFKDKKKLSLVVKINVPNTGGLYIGKFSQSHSSEKEVLLNVGTTLFCDPNSVKFFTSGIPCYKKSVVLDKNAQKEFQELQNAQEFADFATKYNIKFIEADVTAKNLEEDVSITNKKDQQMLNNEYDNNFDVPTEKTPQILNNVEDDINDEGTINAFNEAKVPKCLSSLSMMKNHNNNFLRK